MEFVLVRHGSMKVILIWMYQGESAEMKEFGSLLYAIRWCQEAGIKYRVARPEEVRD
jgi:hypothetical protein